MYQTVETKQRAEILRCTARPDGGRRRNRSVPVQRFRSPAAVVIVGKGRPAYRRQQQDENSRGRRPSVTGDM